MLKPTRHIVMSETKAVLALKTSLEGATKDLKDERAYTFDLRHKNEELKHRHKRSLGNLGKAMLKRTLKISELKKSHNDAMAKARKEYEDRLYKADANYIKSITNLQKVNSDEINKLESDIKDKVKSHSEELSKLKQNLLETHRVELKKLKTAHESIIKNLKEEHELNLDKIRNNHASAISVIEQDYKNAIQKQSKRFEDKVLSLEGMVDYRDNQLSELKKSYIKKIGSIEDDYKLIISDLQKTKKAEIAKINNKYVVEIERTNEKHEARTKSDRLKMFKYMSKNLTLIKSYEKKKRVYATMIYILSLLFTSHFWQWII